MIPASQSTPHSTSSNLWAHLLKKDSSHSQSTPMNPPPLTPIDKMGTSMRMLLHDTQANFESFSARTDKLLKTVEESHRQISVVNDLFQRQHENLSDELANLMNRSQREILKTLGKPAQNDKLEGFDRSVGLRLDGLDKRLDALQAFNQTHSQQLQAQSQSLQTLQDQQGQLLAAISPLLPLIQTIPVHVDNARLSLTEAFKSCLSPLSVNKSPLHLPIPSPLTTLGKRLRVPVSQRPSLTAEVDDPMDGGTLKKPRTESIDLRSSLRGNDTCNNVNGQLLAVRSATTSGRTPSVGRQNTPAAVFPPPPPPRTPRRPLSEIKVFQERLMTPTNWGATALRTQMVTSNGEEDPSHIDDIKERSSPLFRLGLNRSTTTTTAVPPLRRPLQVNSRSTTRENLAWNPGSGSGPGAPLPRDRSEIGSFRSLRQAASVAPGTPLSSSVNLLNPIPNDDGDETWREIRRQGSSSTTNLASRLATAASLNDPQRQLGHHILVPSQAVAAGTRSHFVLPVAGVLHGSAQHQTGGSSTGVSASMVMTVENKQERNSGFQREGRRFIPLVDSDDEDDDE